VLLPIRVAFRTPGSRVHGARIWRGILD
jgi:hypothetical protein